MTQELRNSNANGDEREWLASDFNILAASFTLIAALVIMVGVGSNVFSEDADAPAVVVAAAP